MCLLLAAFMIGQKVAGINDVCRRNVGQLKFTGREHALEVVKFRAKPHRWSSFLRSSASLKNLSRSLRVRRNSGLNRFTATSIVFPLGSVLLSLQSSTAQGCHIILICGALPGYIAADGRSVESNVNLLTVLLTVVCM